MDWITLITALGGAASAIGVGELIKWFANRKSNARVNEAQADQEEVKAEHDEFEYLRQRIEFKEQQLIRAEEREADKTAQIRRLNAELNEMTRIAMEAQTRLAYQEMWRCEKGECTERRPPNPILRGLKYAPMYLPERTKEK